MHTLTILVSFRNRLHNAESHEWSKHGIKWTDSSRLTDLDFADDLSLLAETRDILQEMTTVYQLSKTVKPQNNDH